MEEKTEHTIMESSVGVQLEVSVSHIIVHLASFF
jgi:hypothetical protein